MLKGTIKYKDLKNISVQTEIPLIEVEIILVNLLKIDRVVLKTYPETLINEQQSKMFDHLLYLRMNKVPLGYIINQVYFWDLKLLVNPNVLIPRATTELLVECTFSILPEDSNAKILELGTGSGAIALAIGKNRPNVRIVATDICNKALKVAKFNSINLNINNCEFICSDWFKHTYFNSIPKFDLIISNPPYIAEYEKSLCDPEIFFEPSIALFAEEQGMYSLNQIIQNSRNYLAKNGFLLLEHGFNQNKAVINCLTSFGFTKINYFKDISGSDRVVVAQM